MGNPSEAKAVDWPLPVEASGWDGDMECLILYDVVFKEDWGPWLKNGMLPCLSIDLVKKVVQVHDDDGNLLREVPFKLVPVTQP